MIPYGHNVDQRASAVRDILARKLAKFAAERLKYAGVRELARALRAAHTVAEYALLDGSAANAINAGERAGRRELIHAERRAAAAAAPQETAHV